ncbi:hypothetical protein KC19_10G175300 [Ceratodon purpureus]|uniref:Uncharacterized protein n=1 Tax=Ceratodon purpureus TaxID=3225 RepID=A0A8T0GPF6_CERPU|nr:hypothetical protein KC19_10G175300 [Ceratodon purpureus]
MQFNTGYLHEFLLTVLLTVLEFFSSFSDFSFRVSECENKLMYHENYQIQLRRGIHTAGTSVKGSLVIHYIDNKDKTSTSGHHVSGCKQGYFCVTTRRIYKNQEIQNLTCWWADQIAANLYAVKFIDNKGFVLGNDGVLLRYLG